MNQGKLVKIWVATAVLSFIIEGAFAFLRRGLIANNEIIPWHSPDAHDDLVFVAVAIIGGFAFAYIFLRGYQGRGWMEGVRYGIWVTLLASLTEVATFAAQLNMGRRVPLSFIVGDLVTFIICGVVAALIAGRASAQIQSSAVAA